MRVRQWRDNKNIKLITPRTATPLTPEEIAEYVEHLEHSGTKEITTSAISKQETYPFLKAGFTVREELHLLTRNIRKQTSTDNQEEKPTPKQRFNIRRAYPWEQQNILEIDEKTFDSFWNFDKRSLKEAIRATPTTLVSVLLVEKTIVGYAITGKNGSYGYLQRLAVHPNSNGQGYGTALVKNALKWLESKGARQVLVNTQQQNHRAFRLYETLGFRKQEEGLFVLKWSHK